MESSWTKLPKRFYAFLKMEYLLYLISQNRDIFSDEFVEWIQKNEHVWDDFCTEAFKIHRRGFKHYSARTIIHVLRHHSATAENGSQWKISNNCSPYLARLFDLRYPDYAGMWEMKTCKRAKIDAYVRQNGSIF